MRWSEMECSYCSEIVNRGRFDTRLLEEVLHLQNVGYFLRLATNWKLPDRRLHEEKQLPSRCVDGAGSRAYHRRMSAQGPAVGALLGHYRIVEQVGKGGMGVVFRAWDERLERDVAVKVLPPGTFPDETARKRFQREARVLAKLNHPNIVMAFDFGQQDGIDYLVTEYVPGLTLDAKLASGALSQKKVVELAVQLAKGLAAAHRAHIIHRDLKPGNLRLTDEGELKILDFGLARWREPVSELAATASMEAKDAIGGTLPYMAPEQTRCEAAETREHSLGKLRRRWQLRHARVYRAVPLAEC